MGFFSFSNTHDRLYSGWISNEDESSGAHSSLVTLKFRTEFILEGVSYRHSAPIVGTNKGKGQSN